MDDKILIVCGPTATGKTALALKLAKKFNGEIVSADSRQVYRGMDIGTGKDLRKKISKIKYQISNLHIKDQIYSLIPYEHDGILLWMVDVVDPDGEFSVGHYEKLARVVLEDIHRRKKLPIVVGGTGLYIRSLLSPIETSHIPPNQSLRNALSGLNILELQERLQKDDARLWDIMNSSDRQNPRRLMRKIEIAEYGRQEDRKTVRQEDRKTMRQGDVLIIGLTAPYPYLYKKIDERVEKRVKKGIVREITELLQKGYSWDLASMNTFGYKEWKDYFKMLNPPAGEAGAKCQMLNKREMQKIIQRWKWDEHGYARRQMAWFRKMKGIGWIDISLQGWQEKVEAIIGSWYT